MPLNIQHCLDLKAISQFPLTENDVTCHVIENKIQYAGEYLGIGLKVKKLKVKSCCNANVPIDLEI